MKYKNFEAFIIGMQKLRDRSELLYKSGLDTINYNENFYKIIELLMEEAFSDYNKEWVDWFLNERISHDGRVLKAYNAQGKEICYDIKSLWEEVTGCH